MTFLARLMERLQDHRDETRRLRAETAWDGHLEAHASDPDTRLDQPQEPTP